jgi:hypothetical protein
VDLYVHDAGDVQPRTVLPVRQAKEVPKVAAILKRFNLGVIVAVLLMVFTVSACERSEESFKMQRNAQLEQPYSASPQDTAALIKKLEGAKEMDESQANQPDVSPVTWEDYMTQLGKADHAIKELSHGYAVSPDELHDALWVPPRSIAGAEKARVIGRVEQAIHQDQENEDNITAATNFEDVPYPVSEMATLEEHKNLAQGVAKDLKIGEDVHWQTIKAAEQAPQADQ